MSRLKITCRADELEPQGTSPTNSTNAKVSNAKDFATTKLPKISLITFDGDRTRWVDFRETYKALVHEAADIVTVKKMYYLKGCLKGEAAGVIADIPITSEGYFAAWESLLQCYDNG